MMKYNTDSPCLFTRLTRSDVLSVYIFRCVFGSLMARFKAKKEANKQQQHRIKIPLKASFIKVLHSKTCKDRINLSDPDWITKTPIRFEFN